MAGGKMYLARRRAPRKAKRQKRKTYRAKPAIAAVGMPNSLKVNHVYSEAVYHNPATYTVGYVWRINSLFDPNSTGTGGQPALYDNMAALYRRYRVYAVKISTQFFNTTADSVICSIMYQGHSSAASYSDPNTYFPEGKSSNKVITLDRVSTGGANKTLTAYFNLAKLEGPEVLTDDDYAGAGANPTWPLYASINMQSVAGGNVTVYTRTTLTFYTKWDSTVQPENLIED